MILLPGKFNTKQFRKIESGNKQVSRLQHFYQFSDKKRMPASFRPPDTDGQRHPGRVLLQFFHRFRDFLGGVSAGMKDFQQILKVLKLHSLMFQGFLSSSAKGAVTSMQFRLNVRIIGNPENLRIVKSGILFKHFQRRSMKYLDVFMRLPILNPDRLRDEHGVVGTIVKNLNHRLEVRPTLFTAY